MSVQSILNNVGSANVNTISKATEKKAEEVNTAAAEKTTGFDETAVVYEKSKKEENTVTEKNKNYGIDREAIIAQLKADQEARMNQLTDIVRKMMTQQGNAIGAADDGIWKFLAKGDFTVDADTKAQAQADIAEDGYWGVEKTSERILEFAKALSGGDASKADELLNAFKKGFQQATGAWGKELPEISQNTYKAVEEKFEAWKAESQAAATAAENVTTNALQ